MFSVRRADTADASVLATLGKRLFREAFGSANTAEDMRFYLRSAFSTKRQARELAAPSTRAWLAEDDAQTAIGYAMLRQGPPETTPEVRNAVEIVRFYVDAAWHGRGVAAALMMACVDQAREWECDGLWLGVWDQNARAIAFYQKAGFRIAGTQPFQLGEDRQRDFIMVRPLL
jgi:ribosomal protein S18 acetylase RimI-like enzyme